MVFRKESAFKQYFFKNIRMLYIFTSFSILAGYTIDTLLFFNHFSKVVVLINILTSIIVAFSLALGLLKKIPISTSYLIIIYSTILGMFTAYYYDIIYGKLLIHLLIRNTIVLPMIIFSIGFIVNKKHLLIAGIFISFVQSLLMIISKNNELVEIAPFIAIMVLISSFVLIPFISSMEKSIEENKLKEEELIKQKNKLEELNTDRNNLFSVISHDLRGPVGGAKQMVKYLLDNETSEEEKKFLLEALNSSIGNSYNLLNNLLLWARNERGVIEFEPKNIDLSKSVKETIHLLQKSADEKEIKIENKIQNELISYSDKNLFETIVRNLLSNAIKFTNNGGEIIISCQVSQGCLGNLV